MTKTKDLTISLHQLERSAGTPLQIDLQAPVQASISSSTVVPGSLVSTSVVLESVRGGVIASGTVRARWMGECARCLEVAYGHLEAHVRELFEPGGGAFDKETYPLGDDWVDLEPMVRDACMLELPLRPLCSPNCKGLCSECGTNLNEHSCDCSLGTPFQ
ncbi:MAG TPA: DUF177 domain-containing protein [Acidimicrobiales bacterium]|nr:DUF177 domain-containing protein [Acidimicrobiales bacterium]